MTVAVESPISSYVADGVTSSYPLGFTVSEPTDVSAVLVDIAGNVTVPAASVSAGNLVLTAPPAAGGRVIITRATPPNQLADFSAGDSFASGVADAAFDRIVRIVQELIARVAFLAAGVIPASGLFQTAAVMASEFIGQFAFVNITSSAGVPIVRNASASDIALYANAFALIGAPTGGFPILQPLGLNPLPYAGVAAEVWLSDTVPGSYQGTPPTADGHFAQSLGLALPGQGIFFSPQARFG